MKTLMRTLLVLALAVGGPAVLGAAHDRTVRDIIELSRAGVSEATIFRFVERGQVCLSFTRDDLRAMRAAGVSRRLIEDLVDLMADCGEGEVVSYDGTAAAGYEASYYPPPYYYDYYYRPYGFFPSYFFYDHNPFFFGHHGVRHHGGGHGWRGHDGGFTGHSRAGHYGGGYGTRHGTVGHSSFRAHSGGHGFRGVRGGGHLGRGSHSVGRIEGSISHRGSHAGGGNHGGGGHARSHGGGGHSRGHSRGHR